MNKVTTLNSPDRVLQQIQSNIVNPLNQLIDGIFTDAAIVTLTGSTAVVTGDNVINHKLNRTYVGWIVIDTTAAVAVYNNSAGNAAYVSNKNIVLNFSAPAATVKILFF